MHPSALLLLSATTPSDIMATPQELKTASLGQSCTSYLPGVDSENSALSPSLLNNQLNRGFFSTIRTKLSAAYNWLLYLYLLKWCLTSRRPFFLLEHLLNPTHFLLLFTWTKLGFGPKGLGGTDRAKLQDSYFFPSFVLLRLPSKPTT